MENPCKIVCFGDSITKAYCPKFEKRIKQKFSDINIEVINMGTVGDTSIKGLERLDQVIALKPDVVILGFGMNDWRKGVREDEFKNNMCLMIDSLIKKNIRTIITTMNPSYDSNGEISKKLIEYNNVIRNLAHEKRIKVADIYEYFVKELPSIKNGLYDEIHPNNRVGNEAICDVLMRIVPRSRIVVSWAFNGEHTFCNYSCEYCYVSSDLNMGHYFRGDVENWRNAFKNAFGNQKIVFYLSFGEPMASKNFYKVLDMIASEPNWYGHMTSNLSLPLRKLVSSRIVKEGKLNINASFHPTQTSIDKFLQKLLFLRVHGIECPIVYVMYPPLLGKFEEYFRIFDINGFLVHVRRFRGWYNGKFYPKAYTEEERKFIAKYCDDATIKYMLNDFNINLKGKLTYEGMYYLLVDHMGDVWPSPDSKEGYLGNIFKDVLKCFTAPQHYGLNWNGSVNGISSILDLDYRELENNFVESFSKQGGVIRTETGINYKNMNTNFDDPQIRKKYGFPEPCEGPSTFFERIIEETKIKYFKFTSEYIDKRIYPVLARDIAILRKKLGR